MITLEPRNRKLLSAEELMEDTNLYQFSSDQFLQNRTDFFSFPHNPTWDLFFGIFSAFIKLDCHGCLYD